MFNKISKMIMVTATFAAFQALGAGQQPFAKGTAADFYLFQQEASGFGLDIWYPQFENSGRVGIGLDFKDYSETIDGKRKPVSASDYSLAYGTNWGIANNLEAWSSLAVGYANFADHSYKSDFDITHTGYWFLDARHALEIMSVKSSNQESAFMAEIGVGLRWNLFGPAAVKQAGDYQIPERIVYPYLGFVGHI